MTGRTRKSRGTRFLRALRRAGLVAQAREFGYEHALDDVWDALDQHNPCHDKVRLWITSRRKEVARDGL